MSQPVGFYTGYDPEAQSPEVLHDIQERFGARLQKMSYEQKIVLRGTLASFIALQPVWSDQGNSISCIDACIESVGVDWDVWDADPELVEYIQRCSQLSEGNIEGLIQALCEQIQGKVYASRTHIDHWEVTL
jgi:hypothetical protein